MQVREMKPEEIGLCRELYAQSGSCAEAIQLGPDSPDGQWRKTLLLEKDGAVIGFCRFGPASDADLPRGAFQIECICVQPRWQGRGYGSYLLRRTLHQLGAYQGTELCAWACEDNHAARALYKKFDFVPDGTGRQAENGRIVRLLRRQIPQLTALTLCHEMLASRVRPGAYVVDATAGLGRDTAYLCRLVGPAGRVLALDIQPEAVQATNNLLQQKGMAGIGHAILADHSQLALYVAPHSVDAVVFNFGWLPGGDHAIYTTARTSITALEAALTILKPGGVLAATIYHGGANGTAERDALLPWFAQLDPARYTVVQCGFANRQGKDPIFVLVQG